MNIDGLVTLSKYNAYANGLVLDTVEHASAEELTKETSPSHGSVFKLLRHIFGVEAYFLSVCRDLAPGRETPSTLTELRHAWADLETARLDFIASLTEPDLARTYPVRFCDPPLQYTISQMLLQSLLHSVHHRGELSIVLTGLGHPLPTLDIILQFTAESDQHWPLPPG